MEYCYSSKLLSDTYYLFHFSPVAPVCVPLFPNYGVNGAEFLKHKPVFLLCIIVAGPSILGYNNYTTDHCFCGVRFLYKSAIFFLQTVLKPSQSPPTGPSGILASK